MYGWMYSSVLIKSLLVLRKQIKEQEEEEEEEEEKRNETYLQF